MEKFTVEKQNAGQRLDLLLKFKLPKYSRAAVKKMLNQGLVKVNGEVEYRPNYRCSEGDTLSVSTDETLERQVLDPYRKKIKILYKDEDLVVVNKPIGLKVHPVSKDDNQSLVNAMVYNLGKELNEYGVSLINRIDKRTSGIVLLALSPEGAWHYTKQFSQSKVKKYYLAVVKGNWPSKYGSEKIVAHNFLKYDHLEKRQYVDKLEGDFAHTEFELIDYLPEDGLTLVLAKPITGRTHQIRAQAAHLGFPILGDTKYGGEDAKRMFLHAYRIRIESVAGEEVDIEAPIPEDFHELGFSYGEEKSY